MKTRLQAARVARGFKQSHVVKELAERAAVAGTSIASASSLPILLSDFENGKRSVNESYRRLFRAIYGLTDDELFAPVEDEYETEAPPEYLALAEKMNMARRIDAATIKLFADQTDYLRAEDCRVGATALIDQMTGHLASVQEALSHAIRPSVRRPLASILADSAALAAWQALDVGAVNRAWEHHETARFAAREAEDPVLMAHAMAQQAFVLVDIGEAESAEELVDEATRTAGIKVPARFKAWLYAAQAEVKTAGGKTEGLSGFDKAAAFLPAGTNAVDPELPFIVLNSAHLARWRGNALARLGDGAAIEQLRTALKDGGTRSARAAASLYCDLAQAHLAHGDRDEARKYAAQGRRLAKQAGSVRQKQRIQRIAMLG